ncbi:M23 family metallopeptidase [Aureimonas mangrovi]|uniref:M23 family metallopeptidase n=1 Tax=Aureimonas mangrovi TaxID=2758041 RepID=UPI00163D903D|nr:M23 family metallopeptidase [Aureimonas mangrovi]
MKPASRPPLFETVRPAHTLTISSGARTRSIRLRPWALKTGIAALALSATGCVALAALILSGDNVAAAFKAREARTVSAYEERISDLRRQLDHAASRQVVEQQRIAARMETILERQRAIEARAELMAPLVEEARPAVLTPAPAASAYAAEPAPARMPFEGFDLRTDRASDARLALVEDAPRDVLLDTIEAKLAVAERHQAAELDRLAAEVEMRAAQAASVIEQAGYTVPADASAMGGIFIPLGSAGSEKADEGIARLSGALVELRLSREVASSLPLGRPVNGARRSSAFGVRTDPFLRRQALHSGVDYAARTGSPVLATGDGEVVRAGRNGGYGLAVEIRHPSGHITRYAHLSAIDVALGDLVERGETVGRVGSTGRSTGPHLHYEVLNEGTAVDPAPYLNAGRGLEMLL